MAQLLVVEDDKSVAESVSGYLARHGHEVRVVRGVAEALAAFQQERADLVLVSTSLPDGSGLELVSEIHVEDPTTMLVATSAAGSVEEAVEAMKRGAADYLRKPLDLERLAILVSRSLSSRRMVAQLQYLKARDAKGADIASLVGECEGMRKVFDTILRLGRKTTNTAAPTVMLVGETGTGKGAVARALHYNGRRRDGPFVEVNCASIPESLFEAEVFGAERGAFTGALAARVGYVETADGGTLFLDEIGCLPPTMQAKVLTVLESGTYRRVGSSSERRADFQTIAATNHDLHAAVERNAFREDLLHRLEVIVLEIPPLRERGRDRMLLAEYLRDELCRTYGLQRRMFSDAAIALIESYDWPGNVRELRNALEQIMLLEDDPEIDARHFRLRGGASRSGGGIGQGTFEMALPEGGVALDAIERAVIEHALAACDGNVSQAARWLRISRDQLRYRLAKMRG